MARCFVTRRIPGPALDRLADAHEVEVWPHRLPPTPDELREHAADAEGLLTLLTDTVDEELLAAAPELRAISNYAVGPTTSTSRPRRAAASRSATRRTCSPTRPRTSPSR